MADELSRRSFLKKTAFLFTGAVFVPATGIFRVSEAEARWWAMQGKRGVTSTNWAAWDETSEATLASENTFVVLDEALVDGGDEIGVGGGLVWPDLTLTEAGGVAAATGTPPCRMFNGGGYIKYLTPTSNLIAAFLNTSSIYTIISKFRLQAAGAGRDYYVFSLANSTSDWVYFYPNAAGQSVFRLNDADNDETLTLTTSTPGSTILYAFIYSNGTKTRVGVTTTKPTSWAAIAANDKAEASALYDNFGGAWTGTSSLQAGNTQGTEHFFTVMSKEALIGE